MQERPSASPPRKASAVLRDPAVIAVIALGITQITAWGTTLYSLGVLARPIAADTKWSESLVYSGLTVGLLVAALVSAPIGRLLDRIGGRRVMTIGSVLTAAGLFAVSQVHDPLTYLAAWALLGVAMRMTLYDAAFAALVQITPSRGRRAISYLTLFGGFASSIFWPIGAWLNAGYGWRTTLIVFALINLVLCLPLHWFGLARTEPAEATASAEASAAQSTTAPTAPPLEGRTRRMAMALFALVLINAAFVFGAMAAHLVPLLEASGIGFAAAVTLASLKGFAQVAGRLCELIWGQKIHPITLGRIAILFLPLSFAVLALGGANLATACLFTLLFGITNGLTTIVRGAVPLALFGQKGYGEVLGILAMPYLVLNALAPLVMALIVERGGYKAATLALVGASVAACVAMEIMAAWHRRQKT
jgi:predicted MFS family arabinose efflux permease